MDMNISPDVTPSVENPPLHASADRAAARNGARPAARAQCLQELQDISCKSFLQEFPFPAAIFERQPLADALLHRVSINRTHNPEDNLANSLSVTEKNLSSLEEGRERQRAFKRSRTHSNRSRSDRSSSTDSIATTRDLTDKEAAEAENAILLKAFANQSATIQEASYPGIGGAQADAGHGTPLRELLIPVWSNAAWEKTSTELTSFADASFLDLLSAEDGRATASHLRNVLSQQSGKTNNDLLNLVMGQSSPVDLAITTVETASSSLLVFTLNRSPLLKTSNTPVLSSSKSPTNRGMQITLPKPLTLSELQDSSDMITPEAEKISGFLIEGMEANVKRRRKRRHTEETDVSSMLIDSSRPLLSAGEGCSPLTTNPEIQPPIIPLDDVDPFYQILARYETGRIILSKDWTRSSMGPLESWSPQVKTVVTLAMDSPNRYAVWVGEDMTLLYNDAYIPTAGVKHPVCCLPS